MNQVVSGTRIPIELQFNSRIDGKRSRMTLVAANVSRTLTIQQPSSDRLIAEITDLSPGWYVLRWQILSQDGHPAQGDLPFCVR